MSDLLVDKRKSTRIAKKKQIHRRASNRFGVYKTDLR
jgi:hypothetical protein